MAQSSEPNWLEDAERKEQPEEERESIWSIPARYKGWYFSLFSVQFIIAAVWLIWVSVADDALPSIPKKVFFVWQGMAPMAISSAALSLVIVEGWRITMVIASWLEETLEKRRQRQIKAAVDKARAEGHAEARAEGRAEEREQWQEWNRRREAAAAAGEEFHEPPPGSKAEHP